MEGAFGRQPLLVNPTYISGLRFHPPLLLACVVVGTALTLVAYVPPVCEETQLDHCDYEPMKLDTGIPFPLMYL